MGYCMYLMDHSIHIKKEDFNSALEAVKKAFPKNTDIQAMTTLEEAMFEFDYDPEYSETGDICGFSFDGEKLRDDELFWSTLAPYMEDGDYVEMAGEDFCHWRWTFRNGICKVIEPKLIWEED